MCCYKQLVYMSALLLISCHDNKLFSFTELGNIIVVIVTNHMLTLPWVHNLYHKNRIPTQNTPMNIGTHLDYNNHIGFISTHTKTGTPHQRAPVTMQMEVNSEHRG